MQAGSELNLRHTCSKIVLILSTSQSIKYRFSCLLSISSMMRLNSWMSFMFPTDLAVTCQLFCTAASIIACRMENPEGRKKNYTNFFPFKNISVGVKDSTEFLFTVHWVFSNLIHWREQVNSQLQTQLSR